MTRVGVIVAAYNAAATLRETLESVAAQTLRPDEIIVVDDGSTDDTAEIARSFSGRMPQLRVISTPNGGVCRARNTGIDASASAYLAFLDGDDLWHPTYLEKMARRLDERPECGFAYAFLRHIDMRSRILFETAPHGVDGWGIHQYLARNFIACSSNLVYRREALLAAGCFDTSVQAAEDVVLQLKMCARFPITHVPEHLVGYRKVPNSLSKNLEKMRTAGPVIDAILAEIAPDLDETALRWKQAQRTVARLTNRRKAGRAGLLDVLAASRAIVMDPFRWGSAVFWLLRRKLAPGRPAPFVGQRFDDVSPTEQGTLPRNVPMEMRYAAARRMDERYGVGRE